MEDKLRLKKGSSIECDIDSLAFGGQGVARADDFVVFVRHAIPGQRVQARITKKKQRYAQARIVEIIRESPFAVEPRCRHFGHCGGCLLQHLDYERQIRAKGEQVDEIVRRLAGLQPHVLLTLPSPQIYSYRNKMEFSFSQHRWLTPEEIHSGVRFAQAPYLGLHAGGFYDKVIDLTECHLIDPVAMRVLDTVRQIARDSALPAYSSIDHQGFWRFLVVRCTRTHELMVNVVTFDYIRPLAEQMRDRLMRDCPQITSLLNGVTRSRSSVAFCEEEHLLAGRPTITEQIGPYSFSLSSTSFLQTNSAQAKQLYDVVLDYAELGGDEILYDLYCGAGTISIYLSSHVARVVGFESVASAVLNARENCQLNAINNCEFVLGDLKDELRQTRALIDRFGRPDVVIIDPPRGGMHPKTVRDVLELQPKRIVHVSCNPTTLARELKVLSESYDVTKVQPVDMFPHTAHIEAVAQLMRRDHGSASVAIP
ncbi:23S rRNA (uracil(1939)-C(5))-methyltransferase RlmD [candidate division KSB1 bacterium]|nr:23S rRNA (uracil(1939)-C(5))-methyltransferase RlmD [candidate division KSB1 bacterium]RQW01433.1 MAG: 23S rRNA (uracil(1939)-C(5))-methyltransferase RlmD [candidate division KSB1 bacterium]